MGLYSLGFGLSAAALVEVFPEFGGACQQFRPVDNTGPTPATLIGTVTALFDTKPDFKFTAPSLYAKPEWYGLFDFSATQPGDYLVCGAGTWFVAAIEPLHPPLCIRCNRTLTLKRDAAPPSATGTTSFAVTIGPYDGRAEATDTVLANGWPGSVLLGTKGESNPEGGRLPADTRAGWWKVLLPTVPGVVLHMGDRIEDDTGRAYIVSSAEMTALGFNITAMQAET